MQPNRTPCCAPLGCTETDAGPIRNMHDVFTNRCRRAILYYLQDRDERTSLNALVRQLVEWERGLVPDPSRERSLVDWLRSRIVRTHILEMKQFGILGYDPTAEEVWIPDSVELSVAPPWEDRMERYVRELPQQAAPNPGRGPHTTAG